jgi:outer membrane protein assembly factor BamD
MRHIFLLAVSVLALGLSACSTPSWMKSEEETIADQPVDVLYNKASQAMKDKDYATATKNFEEVERQHPYSQWATQAQLMSAYSSYLGQKYDDAIVALDRFIELHPGNKDIAYAHYLKALCYYEQITDVARDQEMTNNALEAFNTLINRFPESDYTRDAILKRDLTLDHLAGKEMEIGRYYLTRGEVNAAINRFRTVVKDYQTTTHVAEALHRLVESYLTLGLKDEALRVAAVLGYNYPGSNWYKRSYELLDDAARKKLLEDRSFVDRTVESLFKPD